MVSLFNFSQPSGYIVVPLRLIYIPLMTDSDHLFHILICHLHVFGKIFICVIWFFENYFYSYLRKKEKEWIREFPSIDLLFKCLQWPGQGQGCWGWSRQPKTQSKSVMWVAGTQWLELSLLQTRVCRRLNQESDLIPIQCATPPL